MFEWIEEKFDYEIKGKELVSYEGKEYLIEIRERYHWNGGGGRGYFTYIFNVYDGKKRIFKHRTYELDYRKFADNLDSYFEDMFMKYEYLTKGE